MFANLEFSRGFNGNSLFEQAFEGFGEWSATWTPSNNDSSDTRYSQSTHGGRESRRELSSPSDGGSALFHPGSRFGFDLRQSLIVGFEVGQKELLPLTHPYEHGMFSRLYQEVSLRTHVVNSEVFFKPVINTLSNLFLQTPLAVAAFIEGVFKLIMAYTFGLVMLPFELSRYEFRATTMVRWSNYGLQAIACVPQHLTKIVNDLMC